MQRKLTREQGWCSGESDHLPPIWPEPGDIHWLSFFVASCLAPRLILLFSGFPPSTQTNTLNSSSTSIEDLHENQLRLKWLPL